MLVHNGKKDFQCHVCGKYIARKTDLKEHLSTHTKEKAFKCDLCEAHFTRKRSIKQHMLVHTGKKEFYCEIRRVVSNYLSE